MYSKKAKTMGLWFKPSKCWSLSISAGKPKDVTFVLKDSEDMTNATHHIGSVHKKDHKFLGSLVTVTCNPSDYFKQLFETLKLKLENIEKTKYEENTSWLFTSAMPCHQCATTLPYTTSMKHILRS